MKITSLQSLAVGVDQKFSADNNDAEIINLDDSSDENEVDATDPTWSSLITGPESVERLDLSSQNLDVESVLSPGDCDIKSIDENPKDEGISSDSPPESSEVENCVHLTDSLASPDSVIKNCEIESPESPDDNGTGTGKLLDSPASPDGEEHGKDLESPKSPDGENGNDLESPESPNDNGTGKLLDSPTSPDGEERGKDLESPESPDGENGNDLESPESPDPASPQAEGSSMKVRIEGVDGNGTSLILYNPGILALPAQKKVVVNSSLGVKSRQVTESSQYEEDWEAESEPNPPFPELNKTLDYAGILALRAQNKAEVDSSRSVKSRQATESVQWDAKSDANPPLPVLKYATITRCLPGARNDAAINWPNDNKVVGLPFGCYNCKGDHRCAECPLPLNRDLIKKRRQESKRNQNQRYDKEKPSQSKYGQFKPGKISNHLRSAMDIRRNELPDYIYKMRIHGYPPGYLQQAEDSASFMKFFGGDSALQTLLQGNHSTLRRTGLMEYPGFTTPAPKGFVDDGDRFNAPYSNKHSLDNVARNYVDKSKGPAGIPPPIVAWMPPKKPIQTTSQFSNSCLGYDRPMPFFNPLPAEDSMGRAVEIYHGLVLGKKVCPSRDIVAEVERTGNYSYKISESLEQMETYRRAEEARKEKLRLAPNPARRMKRCRSPSLLDPPGFPDSEDSEDVNWSPSTVARNKVPNVFTSTVTSSIDDDDCKIIGVEQKAPKLPLDTIVIDSDDDDQAKDSTPVYLPNPVYKKPKLMSEVLEQVESQTRASSTKSKEWGDFLAEYNIIPENNDSKSSQGQEIQFMEVDTPKIKTNLQNSRYTIDASTRLSQVKPVKGYGIKLDDPPNSKLNLHNDLPPMDNSSRDQLRFQSTVIEKNGQLRLMRLEVPENKMAEVTAEEAYDDDDDDIQIIE